MQFVNEGNNPEQFNPEQAVDIEAFIKEFNENFMGRDPPDDALGGRSGYAGVLALPVGAVVDRPYVYE